jgi:hypothetical protein
MPDTIFVKVTSGWLGICVGTIPKTGIATYEGVVGCPIGPYGVVVQFCIEFSNNAAFASVGFGDAIFYGVGCTNAIGYTEFGDCVEIFV